MGNIVSTLLALTDGDYCGNAKDFTDNVFYNASEVLKVMGNPTFTNFMGDNQHVNLYNNRTMVASCLVDTIMLKRGWTKILKHVYVPVPNRKSGKEVYGEYTVTDEIKKAEADNTRMYQLLVAVENEVEKGKKVTKESPCVVRFNEHVKKMRKDGWRLTIRTKGGVPHDIEYTCDVEARRAKEKAGRE